MMFLFNQHITKSFFTAFLLLIFIFTFFPSCSKKLLKREDYRPSVNALKNGQPQNALKRFPKKEKHTFITIMEKTYLNLISGNPDIDELRKYSHKIENRLKYQVSRELKYLVYVETPEGYYASEHEIIWMHMLLSWGYSLREEYDSAAIEAKKAALILEGKSQEGRFDDPMIRIILGTLFAMCGRWDDARVDYRVAAKLDRKLHWAARFANMEMPPDHLTLILSGTGPEPYWDPGVKWNPVRGLRDIKFKFPRRNDNIYAYSENKRRIPVFRTPDSSPWYVRHLERENAIHKLINDSNYGQRTIYSATKGAVKATAGITAGILVGVGGTALGGLIIYAGVYGSSGEAIFAGGAVIVWSIQKGFEIAKDAVRRSIETAKREMDVSANYRFVRFLPDRAFVIYGNGKPPVEIQSGHRRITVKPDSTHSGRITILYIPK
ncbi:MAG: hypothetical protein OEZ34_11095 [Spirochaetia bacterium]|nr:hypothetical protein [Spirochaetia bacterium]